MPTVEQIRDAWLNDLGQLVWFARRNKMHTDGCQWEVVRDDGEAMKVVERFDDQQAAEQHAFDLEHDARATAVLAVIQKQQ